RRPVRARRPERAGAPDRGGRLRASRNGARARRTGRRDGDPGGAARPRPRCLGGPHRRAPRAGRRGRRRRAPHRRAHRHGRAAAGAMRACAGTITTAYFSAGPAPVETSPALAGAGLAIGALVALTAAWFPAARAAAEAPNDAIRRGPEETTGRRVLSPLRLAL